MSEEVCEDCKWITGSDHPGGCGWHCLNPLNDQVLGIPPTRYPKRIEKRFEDKCSHYEPDAVHFS